MNFDDVINATDSNIISEQHDFSKIVPAGPKADPGEYAPTTEMAIARANIATTADGRAAVMVAREKTWHEMGVIVYNAPTIADAMAISGIAGRNIRKQRMYTRVDGELVYTDQYALVRGDTGQVLPGSVGSSYEVVQDEEVYALLDQLGDNVHYESAGVLGKGERSWMLAKMEDMTVDIGGTDRVESYVLFVSRHGCGSILAIPCSIRVECDNTLNAALAKGKGKRKLSFRHTKNVRQTMAEAVEALRAARDDLATINQRSAALAEAKIDQPLEYFGLCIDHVLAATIAGRKVEGQEGSELLRNVLAITDADEQQRERAKLDRLLARRGQLLDRIVDVHERRYSGRGDKLDGSAWMAANAVTDVLQHDSGIFRQRGTDKQRAENRFDATVDGRVAEESEYAMALAASLAVSA